MPEMNSILHFEIFPGAPPLPFLANLLKLHNLVLHCYWHVICHSEGTKGMRMSLKTKLVLASCGPLLILLVVGLISIRTITESGKTLERIFRENYNSVVAALSHEAGDRAKSSGALRHTLWEGSAERTSYRCGRS